MPKIQDHVAQQILGKLRRQYPDLELVKFFDTGSTARVFHVRMRVGPEVRYKVDRIVKVFRHDGDIVDFPDLGELFANEIRSLISISHTNVISIYSTGTLPLTKTVEVPYYVMEYLPGAKDIDRWLNSVRRRLTSTDVVELLLQTCAGIQALHERGILHCDIKFGNLLVGDRLHLKVADLGFSKLIRTGEGSTGVFTTQEPFPKRYSQFIRSLTNPSRMLVTIPRDKLDRSFDLHYLARVVTKLLALPKVASLFDRLDQKSLALMANRMDLDEEPSLPRYDSIEGVIDDLKKLKPSYFGRPGVRELSTYTGTRTIRIPVSGSIPFSDRVQNLVSHPLFQRLHSALQLGFTYYVFPGAAHTRFEHSLGVFANVARYINSLLSDDYQPYFRQVVDEQKIATTLVAGLIHDVGQHSFAHSLEDISMEAAHEDVAEAFITGEGIGELVYDSFYEQGPLGSVIEASWPEVDATRLRWLITGRPSTIPTDIGWDIMRSIINGPVDADKTDYLVRDAHHAGVEYAHSIDITRFMNSLTASAIPEKGGLRGVVAITWKGAQSAENIIIARSQMFWVLYWHHAVRSAHAMLAQASYFDQHEANAEQRRDFKRVLFCGTIGELLSYLSKSSDARARSLADLLRLRRLYKRGISLDFQDNEGLYLHFLDLKEAYEEAGDFILQGIANEVAVQANRELGKVGARARLKADDVIVDIPKATKDKLGAIYIVYQHSEVAERYHSRGLTGTSDDWQNRVRTLRIFFHPRIDRDTRVILRERGEEILKRI